MKQPSMSKGLKELVGSVMGQLERDKPQVDLGDKAADREHCEAFAVNIFNRADRADREGKADQATAKAFYAASIFIDVLEHFGELDADLAAKKKYALWKAGDIRKALKAGRRPMPGSPTDQLMAFRPGSKVYFVAEAGDAPREGTVAKAEVIEGEQVFTVALQDTFVQAPLDCLALRAERGEAVLYRERGGSELGATVESMDLQHWPPSYVIRLEQGGTKDTGPDRIRPPPPQRREQPAEPPAAPAAPGPAPAPAGGSECGYPAPSAAADNGYPSLHAPPAGGGGAHHQGPSPPTSSSLSSSSHSAAPPPPPPAPAATVSAGPSPVPQAKPQPGFVPDGNRIMSAKKLAKSAASSLDFDDVQTSVKLLTQALRLLTDPSN